jgi:cytochrome c oxidase subunit 2
VRLIVLVLVGLFSLSVQAADVAAGKALYATCAACHGPNAGGNQAMNSPKTAGQHGWYIKRQLQAFKEGIRGTAPGDVYGAQMRPMAMTLANEAAIDNVVAYIATLSAPTPAVTVKGDAAVGKQLYTTCAACHGAKAEGNVQLNSPRLSDQDDWYLVRQLQNYKTGVRGSNPKDVYGMQMKPMAGMLANDQAINNVVAYIGTLK